MTNRSNIPGRNTQEYYKATLFIPIIDHLVAERYLRFSQTYVSTVCGMYVLPKNIVEMTDEHRANTLQFFEWALPSPQTFNQKLGCWRKMWQKASVGVPSKLVNSLEACNQKLFPNIYTCLHLLMIIQVSTAAIECNHSCLQVVKKDSINNGPEQVECTDATLHSQGYTTQLQQDH